MVVDTSALIAVLLGEPEAERLKRVLRQSPATALSSVALVEATLVLLPRLGKAGVQQLDTFIEEVGIELAPVTRDTAMLAHTAFADFGKGRHPAALNFGDCFSYALAIERGEPLLFVGNDFTQTNVKAAPY